MKTRELLSTHKNSLNSIKVISFVCLLIFLQVIFSFKGQCQTIAQHKLDSLLSGLPQNGSGGVVVVIDRQNIICSGKYGYANIEWKIPAGMDSKFRIGSLTKTFTAMAILQLEEKGKISLKDKVSKWLPEKSIDDNIRIENLLSHTSGIQENKKETDFTPGERMNYSNYGYILLGEIISRVTGISYAEYLRENILKPLGMNNTGYDNPADILVNRASGYRLADKNLVNAPYTDMTGPGAAGGLYSTPDDMVKFEKSLYGNTVFSGLMLKKSFTPFTLNNGQQCKYGYGWITDNYKGWREVSHGGDIEGFNCYFAHFPDKQRTVIVMQNIKIRMGSNWSESAKLVHNVVSLLWNSELQNQKPTFKSVEVPVEKLTRLSGVYEFENIPPEMMNAMGSKISVSVESGKLFVQDKNGRAPVNALSETEFAAERIDLRFNFIIGKEDKATGVILKLMGLKEFTAIRVQ